ncbi:UDP-N-acetylmuramoyl-L-alanyl-D-glutamate--2,6-diaminopimelate ligase [Aquibacillus koreensis]|uniref:UDP-N-acetylmuramoyl-L-alanyl-D-glutamate--2,6-diaminopimelate ligase n=1 Tax=Aquibacillus koreensis TaxID=279446 RepID=A0A9X3WKY9_9BACI|nr:UDP-N-acetylmuramoyl-L-alanyl-D-glutamate--2,6-diaminopimelate ligase [Aquibacillus koreensis]MCT2538062.1 UDP-N-acetylmuramoyl-L-alanyl-D-glutamate--2,6-diaminopimelate ligase [Aquibacillus koreensis]MDC3420585.1 UDP-N-acetylmuramoyl-L-alanyl-D-glutamate--2,6-diaminopimelate ligase [Aquibacillus koreensis]
MKLSEISSIFYHKSNSSMDDLDISGIAIDHRKVEPGNIFVCLKGFTVDGHNYADQAINNGAVAVLAEKDLDVHVPLIVVSDTKRALAMVANHFYQYPTRDLRLIGITGTNGKTSVTYLLDDIFKKHKHKTALIGTIQMKIGEETFDVKNTTPESLFLQSNFSHMVNEKVETVFMEVSSHALDLGRVYGCDYDIAIFTNLSQDHLDYHDSMESYLHAKSLLFSQLGNSYHGSKSKFAVVNKDDVHSDFIIKSTAQAVVTFAIDSRADITASNITLDANGSKFTLNTPDGKITIKSKLMGRFSIYNMLASATAAICSGVPLSTIKDALEETTGVNGRFEPVSEGQSYGVIVDYAHTPDSLENVLTTIRSFAKGNVYVVVGCGGDRDKTKRPLMAKIAAKYADMAIFTSDNPRSEDPEEIINDMINGMNQENFKVILNRKDAINHSIEIARENDIVLIAGKGHETYQIIGDEVLSFDDRKEAKHAILKRNPQ